MFPQPHVFSLKRPFIERPATTPYDENPGCPLTYGAGMHMCPGINLTRDFTHSSIAALLLGWDWEIEAGGMVFKHVPVCRLCVIGYPTVLVLCSLVAMLFDCAWWLEDVSVRSKLCYLTVLGGWGRMSVCVRNCTVVLCGVCQRTCKIQ